MLDGDKTILGINTLWSMLLPVAIGIHQYTQPVAIPVPAMQVCLKYISCIARINTQIHNYLAK